MHCRSVQRTRKDFYFSAMNAGTVFAFCNRPETIHKRAMEFSKMKKILTIGLLLCLTGVYSTAQATVRKTAYPVVFAHGLAGWNDILGYFYFGDDGAGGNFVGDACNEFLEIVCNGGLNSGQKAYAAGVQPFQSSEVRGTQLADAIQSYLATVGSSYVNIVGHSQGGIDARKAAQVLKARKGYTVVKTLISVTSPHRGSPVAKYILNLGPGVTSIIATLANYYGSIIYASGNDPYAAAMQLVYDNYTACVDTNTSLAGCQAHAAVNGMKAYNLLYPATGNVSNRVASLVFAQQGADMNPALWLLSNGFYNIDGDGSACATIDSDCDADGAGGRGNGNNSDTDDDGLVGINSAQMGYRLIYNTCFLCDDYMNTDTASGSVDTINSPSSAQQSSHASIVSQDHLDPTGVPPDMMDEYEFYAAVIDYMAAYGG